MSKFLELLVEIQQLCDTMDTQRVELEKWKSYSTEVALERNKFRQDLQAATEELEAVTQQRDAATTNFERLEEESICAETVLDSYAASLKLKETSFDCISDYIRAVIEAKHDPDIVRNQLMQELAENKPVAKVHMICASTMDLVLKALEQAHHTSVMLEAHKQNWLASEAKRKDNEEAAKSYSTEVALERNKFRQDLRKDAERLDWIGARLFGSNWNGVIGSGSRTYWRIAGDFRHTTQKMVGSSFREAIDAAQETT